jgi:radical SAM protein (TIGR01212 family)
MADGIKEIHRRLNMIGPWLRRRCRGKKVTKIGLDLNLGCPLDSQGQRCLYCAPSAAGSGRGTEPLSRQMDAALTRGDRRWLAYFQAHTSTNAPASYLEPLFRQAAAYPGVVGLVISTRPDCLGPEHWRLLAALYQEKKLCWLELGLQSAHEDSLRLIRRGHGLQCFEQALSRARELTIPAVAHVILGLPGEDISHTNFTAHWLAQRQVWGVKLHSLMVLPNTGLERMWRRGDFAPWELERWIEACAAFVSRLPAACTIHRLSADPGPETCLAPDWIGNKNYALHRLGMFLREHDIVQGREF